VALVNTRERRDLDQRVQVMLARAGLKPHASEKARSKELVTS
jgi:hypothetical protein